MPEPDHPDWPEWKRILYHESGHAALCLDLWDQSAPIVVLKTTGGNGDTQRGGRFKVKIGVKTPVPGEPPPDNKPPLEQVMVCAAGGVTELVKFNHDSDGFAKDKNQIELILKFRRDDDARNERDAKFPRTHELVVANDAAIEALAQKAIEMFMAKELIDKDFKEEELLDADTVRSIFRAAMGLP